MLQSDLIPGMYSRSADQGDTAAMIIEARFVLACRYVSKGVLEARATAEMYSKAMKRLDAR